MSTFLALCRRTAQEAGVSNDAPSAVTSQSGMAGKIVNWVLAAHEEIQLKHPNWRFDWAQATKVLAAQESYNPVSDWSLSVRQWDEDGAYVYATAAGAASRTLLSFEPWDYFRDLRIQGQTGQPHTICQAPDRTVKFYPVPTAAYTAVLDYWRLPEVLTNTTDVPRMPTEYHMAIVWRAVMLYCGHDENSALYQAAQVNFDRLMNRMEDTELDKLETAGPLA